MGNTPINRCQRFSFSSPFETRHSMEIDPTTRVISPYKQLKVSTDITGLTSIYYVVTLSIYLTARFFKLSSRYTQFYSFSSHVPREPYLNYARGC